MSKTIDKLIINSAYKEPEKHWKYSLKMDEFLLEEGRRPAGFFIASQGSNQYNDVGEFIQLPIVNDIRRRVKKWREEKYPGITSITRQLIEHWRDQEKREYPFFFCQLDAIETLIWHTEAPDSEKVGIDIDQNGNEFQRLCSKMATGTGKTTVMAMLIVWNVLNKTTYPTDKRFSKYVLIITPGLTVKNRLSVLMPSNPNNYYDYFDVIPISFREKFNQARILITNWQTLQWDTEETLKNRKSVDKRGPLSDEAYSRMVFGDSSGYSNIVVINDEAHHAWKKNPEIKIKADKDMIQEATIWIGGLEKINRARNIQSCYDFSATPFAPSGKKNDEEALFGWIVSDFGLNDAIESGLVKTPRVVVRDNSLPDSKTYKSKLYHIYVDKDVKDDLNRRAEPDEPLPDLVINAYTLLGFDYHETFKEWKAANTSTPPVMISVVNRTETASRIKYSFDHHLINIEELCDEKYTIQIDSNLLKKCESGEIDVNLPDSDQDIKLTNDQKSALLRQRVNTVGQIGNTGADVRNIISVAMLSEGWDAKTVTHIMGLRAFSSQLLCEQAIGRGLRRTSYDVDKETGLFSSEYVNIFGIPFSFLPHESSSTKINSKPQTQIRKIDERVDLKIDWPNIIRIDRVMNQKLELTLDDVPVLTLNASDTKLIAEMSPIVDGKTYLKDLSEIDLRKIDEEIRLQTVILTVAGRIFDSDLEWKSCCTKFGILGQIYSMVDKFINSSKLIIQPQAYSKKDSPERRVILSMNAMRIVQHIRNFIKIYNTDHVEIVLDSNRPFLSTDDMATWYTTKPCCITKKSHIDHCVLDSTYESSDSYALDNDSRVITWVKNDHIGFEISYIYRGSFHKYRPDFIIRLNNDEMLVLETKGVLDEQAQVKFEALNEWINAINDSGKYGHWNCDLSLERGNISEILNKYTKS